MSNWHRCLVCCMCCLKTGRLPGFSHCGLGLYILEVCCLVMLPVTIYSVGHTWVNESGAMMGWYWQGGKIEVLGGKPLDAHFRLSRVLNVLACAQTQASVLRGCWQTAWSMARPFRKWILFVWFTKLWVCVYRLLSRFVETFVTRSKPDKPMRSALFWDITQRRVMIPYGRFGAINRSHLNCKKSKVFAHERSCDVGYSGFNP